MRTTEKPLVLAACSKESSSLNPRLIHRLRCFKVALMAMTLFALVACGGGGGGAPESVPDSNLDPITDPTTDPTTDPITDPTTDPITDPTTDPITDPTTDPNTDPTTDPTTDPITDPTTDPITDPTTDPITDPTGSTINVTYTKGPVSGANAELLDANGTIIAGPVPTLDGQATFVGVTYTGSVYARFSGGSYTDEATGSTVMLASSFQIRSGVIASTNPGTLQITATPLTEIGFQRADAAAGGAANLNNVNSYIEVVADEYGLDNVNLTTSVPTPLQNITGNSEGDRYGTVLVAITQQLLDAGNPPSGASLASYIAANTSSSLDQTAYAAALSNIQSNSNTSAFVNSTAIGNISLNSGAYNLALDILGIGYDNPKTSLVVLTVHASDKVTGKSVTGLRATDFNILDDGLALGVESFMDVEPIGDIPYRFRTVFMVDVSTSISDQDLIDAKVGLKNYVKSMKSFQEVAIYIFDDQIQLVQDFSGNISALETAIDSLQRGNSSTNLYGAIVAGSNRTLNSFTLAKVEYGSMVIITDGDHSAGSAAGTIAAATSSVQGKQVFAVPVGAAGQPGQPLYLNLVSIVGSLNVLPTNNYSQLGSSLSAIQADLEDYFDGLYSVYFASPKRGGIHNIELSVINNANSSQDAVQSETYDATNFTAITPEVIISGPEKSHIDEAALVWTIDTRWSNDAPNYSWSSNGANHSITPNSDGSKASISASIPGYYDITVTDNSSTGAPSATRKAWIAGSRAPYIVNITQSDLQEVSLTWSNRQAVSYNLYWGTSPGLTQQSNSISIPGTDYFYTHTGLTDGVTYYYRVEAVFSNGVSGLTAEQSITPSTANIINFELNYSAKQLQFTWNAIPNFTYYQLFENPNGISGFTQLGANMTVTNATIDISVHKFDWQNARYFINVCDASRCLSSPELATLNQSANSIGVITDHYIQGANYGDAFGDAFGESVALSGNGKTLVVGVPFEDSFEVLGPYDNSATDYGKVQIYSLYNGGWSPYQYIKSDSGDKFGRKVAISSDGFTLAVTSHRLGSAAINANVEIFSRSANSQFVLQHTIRSVVGGFGATLSFSSNGDVLAVGGAGATADLRTNGGNNGDDIGAVYLYSRNNGVWAEQSILTASNADFQDAFGNSVSLSADGNTLAVGAIGESSNAVGIDGNQSDNSVLYVGAVYVFSNTASGWVQQAYVKPPQALHEYLSFGWDVSLSADGDTLAVSTFRDKSNAIGVDGDQLDTSAPGSGAVHIYARSNSSWSHKSFIKASNTEGGDNFGISIDLSEDGSTLAIYAYGERGGVTGINANQLDNSEAFIGAVYVFAKSGNNWSQISYVKPPVVNELWSISLNGDGSTLAIGGNNSTNTGAVYLY